MCLQDLQLARAALVDIHTLTAIGSTATQILPSNPTRIGLLFLGTSSNVAVIRLGGSIAQNTMGSIASATEPINRVFSIFEYGKAIQEPIFAFGSGGNAIMTVYEYSLPLDPENLERLAKLGKW